MSRERGRFAGDPFHHAAVAAQRVDVEVVDRGKIRLVIARREPPPGDCHSDAIGIALPERPCRRLDAGCQMRLRMAGAPAAELPEILDVRERDSQRTQNLAVLSHIFDAGEVQHGIQKHGRMSGGENKTIAVRPVRVARVVAQKLLPENVGERRHRHRRAGMPGDGGLHSVHRKRANRVDAQHFHRAGGILNGSAGIGHAHDYSFVAVRPIMCERRERVVLCH